MKKIDEKVIHKACDFINQQVGKETSTWEIKAKIEEEAGIYFTDERHFDRNYFEPYVGCSISKYIEYARLKHAVKEYEKDPYTQVGPRDTYRGVHRFKEKYMEYRSRSIKICGNKYAVMWRDLSEELANYPDYSYGSALLIEAPSEDDAIKEFLYFEFERWEEWLRVDSIFRHYLELVQYGDIYDNKTFLANEKIKELSEKVWDSFWKDNNGEVEVDELIEKQDIKSIKEEFEVLIEEIDIREAFYEAFRYDVVVILLETQDDIVKKEEKRKKEFCSENNGTEIMLLKLLAKMIRAEKKEAYRIDFYSLKGLGVVEEKRNAILAMLSSLDFRPTASIEFENSWAAYALISSVSLSAGNNSYDIKPADVLYRLAAEDYSFDENSAERAKEKIKGTFSD